MKTLSNICYELGSDKVKHGYTQAYEKHFEKFRFSNNILLEIGLWKGASLRVWDAYFTHTTICGMDFFDKSGLFTELKNKWVFIQGDQGNSEHLQKLCERTLGRYKEYDIIIDDGSHMQHDQMISLAYLFPRLRSGGLYIIEDIVPAKELADNAMWWGTSDEIHAGTYGLSLNSKSLQLLRTDKDWLPGGVKDIDNCTERTFQRYMDCNFFSNTFLSEQQNKYINENIDWVEFYPAGWYKDAAADKCTSSLVIICKK